MWKKWTLIGLLLVGGTATAFAGMDARKQDFEKDDIACSDEAERRIESGDGDDAHSFSTYYRDCMHERGHEDLEIDDEEDGFSDTGLDDDDASGMENDGADADMDE